MEFKIVFIDDNMREGTSDAFVRAIGRKQPLADISVFTNPTDGLKYVMENLNSQIIAFIDCKMDGYSMQGIDVLRKIREKTSLLCVVMMSANSLKQMDFDLAPLINEDYIWFYDRNNGSVEDACGMIEHIRKYWTSRFDCVLERWLCRHPEDMSKIALRRADKTYTWKQILSELRLQTEVGRLFEQMVNEYYIYQLNGRENE